MKLTNYFCSDIKIQRDSPCTISKTSFLTNTQNKTQLIGMLSGLFREYGIKVIVSEYNADTLLARTALNISFRENVEV